MDDERKKNSEDKNSGVQSIEVGLSVAHVYAEKLEKFIKTSKKHVEVDKLDAELLHDMIQAIYVSEPDKSSGKRIQAIHIAYDGIGFIPLDELMKEESV